MKIEIWSDVVCPFCYIGKRNFENALHQFPGKEEVEVIWKSFQLDPTISKTAEPQLYTDQLSKKTGWSKEETDKALESMSAMAKSVGLEFNLEGLKSINTFDTHRIIQYSKLKDLGSQAEEAFFKSFFTDGKDLTKKETQIEIMQNIGLTETDLEKAMSDDLYEKMTKADIEEAKQLQISGVPFFVIDRKYAVSGAQPSEAFTQTLETAFQEWKAENPTPELQVVQGQSCDVNGKCD